jgi:GNAT superfamily N-acetyltransferase
MIIREATPDDAEQMIAHVQRLASEPESNIPLMPGEFQVTVDEERNLLEKYAAADNSVFLVAEDNGRIVGVLNCNGGKRQAARHSVVLGMSVAREWRNRGVGGKLLSSAIEWANSIQQSRAGERVPTGCPLFFHYEASIADGPFSDRTNSKRRHKQ